MLFVFLHLLFIIDADHVLSRLVANSSVLVVVASLVATRPKRHYTNNIHSIINLLVILNNNEFTPKNLCRNNFFFELFFEKRKKKKKSNKTNTTKTLVVKRFCHVCPRLSIEWPSSFNATNKTLVSKTQKKHNTHQDRGRNCIEMNADEPLVESLALIGYDSETSFKLHIQSEKSQHMLRLSTNSVIENIERIVANKKNNRKKPRPTTSTNDSSDCAQAR